MKQIIIYYMYMFIMTILVILSILVSVAFLTLMERKILGLIQNRKGPNKVGVLGILQPFSDAIKLLMKESYLLYKLNFLYYYISPMFMLVMILMLWMIYPFYSNLIIMNNELIYFLCCLSLGSFSMVVMGWCSNSMYSMLGAMRSLAQVISYEISLLVILMCSFILIDSLNFKFFQNIQIMNFFSIIYMWPMSLMFFFSIMAELNRSPFDFSEGESELVSGFNVEYMSSGFVMIFLSEYASILFMSILFSIFYLGMNINMLMFYLNIIILSFMIIWIRGSLPRFRYDLLMNFCWLIILPFSLLYLYFIVMIFKIFL